MPEWPVVKHKYIKIKSHLYAYYYFNCMMDVKSLKTETPAISENVLDCHRGRMGKRFRMFTEMRHPRT